LHWDGATDSLIPRGFLRGRSRKLGADIGANAALAVTRITRFAVVNFFAGGGNRIERSRNRRRGERARGGFNESHSSPGTPQTKDRLYLFQRCEKNLCPKIPGAATPDALNHRLQRYTESRSHIHIHRPQFLNERVGLQGNLFGFLVTDFPHIEITNRAFDLFNLDLNL
jgi:hypothetical protein